MHSWPRTATAGAFWTSRNSWMIYKTLTIDSAYCIDLGRRPDRRRVVVAEFQAADLSARVAFFDAIDGSVLMHAGAVSDGGAGCCMSHLAVLPAARAKGHRHVLVFEGVYDDIGLALRLI
jgi:GR25 family glycosyltransferase involved in LPS biosynthesis